MSDAVTARHARRLAALDAARAELDALRKDVLGAPPVRRWLQRRPPEPTAADRLAEVLRHRARAADLADRLDVEDAALRHDRAHAAEMLALALDEARPTLLDAAASARALATVCDEAAADLHHALSDDHARSRRELSAAVSRVDRRIQRVVRLEEDRGVLLTARLDALVHAFAPLAPDSPQGQAAEREVARALIPPTLDDLIRAARRR